MSKIILILWETCHKEIVPSWQKAVNNASLLKSGPQGIRNNSKLKTGSKDMALNCWQYLHRTQGPETWSNQKYQSDWIHVFAVENAVLLSRVLVTEKASIGFWSEKKGHFDSLCHIIRRLCHIIRRQCRTEKHSMWRRHQSSFVGLVLNQFVPFRWNYYLTSKLVTSFTLIWIIL